MRSSLQRVEFAALAICAAMLCAMSAQTQPTRAEQEAAGSSSAPARFEAASITAPAGSLCTILPEGDRDPQHGIRIHVDADGVARFQAVRPTRPGAIERLTMNCTDVDRVTHSYTVDLRSAATFAAHPFDARQANLEVRPPLKGDPLNYTVKELIAKGYGLRPSPKGNPTVYAQWLQAASIPVYKVGRPARNLSSSPRVIVRAPDKVEKALPGARAGASVGSASCGSLGSNQYPCYWTGVVLKGSHDATHNYLANYAVLTVPALTPGGFGTSDALMSIWAGLDNVFQPIVWAQSSPSSASYNIEDELVDGNVARRNPGVSPSAGDSILLQEWYCDAAGNPNLNGGYGCTHVTDTTIGLVWDCTNANDSNCSSIQIPSGFKVGRTAEYVIENDTAQIGSTQQWPDFSSTPVQVIGGAVVVAGDGTGTDFSDPGLWINMYDDPNEMILADWPAGPASTGNSHVAVTLSYDYSGVKWTNVSGRAAASISPAFPNIDIPVGMSGMQAFFITTHKAWEGQETVSSGVEPFNCTISGDLGGKFIPLTSPDAPYPDGPVFTFNMPLGTPVGKVFHDTISCGPIGPSSDQNPSTAVTITASKDAFSASPSSAKLVEGNCVGMSFVWGDPSQGYCGTTYMVTTPLPAGITTTDSNGMLSICANSPTPAPLGSFSMTILSGGCSGSGSYTTKATVDVVPPPPCQPRTCGTNSCEGTVPDGCGGTLHCPTTCSANLQCKGTMPEYGTTCCAPTQIVNSYGACDCPSGAEWDPGSGPVGACKALCPAGKQICDVTGTCLTALACKSQEIKVCPPNAKKGTCM
ncbi:MAG: hypothetical protein WCA21_06570 [Terracidiphilus sp.]